MFNVHWFVYSVETQSIAYQHSGQITNISVEIYIAWASALLILGGRQCESLTSGMSDETQIPALFLCGLEYNIIMSGLGVAGKI